MSYASPWFFANLLLFTLFRLLVLDVYVISTDGHVQDFKFPQTSKSGATLQLSSNTVKVNSKNGKKMKIWEKAFWLIV